jgi:hypothetical protein
VDFGDMEVRRYGDMTIVTSTLLISFAPKGRTNTGRCEAPCKTTKEHNVAPKGRPKTCIKHSII